jgi:hypothetical protein
MRPDSKPTQCAAAPLLDLRGSETVLEDVHAMAHDVELARARANDLFAVFASQMGALVAASHGDDARMLRTVQRELVDVVSAQSASVRDVLANIEACSRTVATKELAFDAQARAEALASAGKNAMLGAFLFIGCGIVQFVDD